MKTRQLIWLTLFFLGTFQLWSNAQVSLGTTGGELNGNKGSVSYSVGQYLSAIRFGEMTSLQLGVQQAFEISVVTGIDEELLAIAPMVFPNPSPGIVYLKFSPSQQKTYHYQLRNMQGQVLKKGKLRQAINPIDLTPYATQVLFISINHQERTLKTFKIIKP